MELQKYVFILGFSVKLILVGRQCWLVMQMKGNLQSFIKGYLRYKMITPWSVLSEAQVENFFIL